MSNLKTSVKAGPKKRRTATSLRTRYTARMAREYILAILRKSLDCARWSDAELSAIVRQIGAIPHFSLLSSKAENLSQQYQTLIATSMQATNTMEETARKSLDGLLKIYQCILSDFVRKRYFRPTQILPALTLMVFCQIAQREPQSVLGQKIALEVYKLLATLPAQTRDHLLDYMNPLDA